MDEIIKEWRSNVEEGYDEVMLYTSGDVQVCIRNLGAPNEFGSGYVIENGGEDAFDAEVHRLQAYE